MPLEMGEQSCAMCGLGRSQWQEEGGQGYTKDGQTYCCRGCAEGTGCSCQSPVRQR